MKNFKIIYKNNLIYNLNQFNSKKICAMVKSNAYGHDLKDVVKIVEPYVDYFGVVSVEEGKEVRKLCDKPILICSKVFDFSSCKKHNLEVMVDCENDLALCCKHGLKDLCHLKLNCGMNRFGIKSPLQARLINNFLEEKEIKLKSIYTHFPCSDNKKETWKNYRKFQELRAEISQNVPVCFGGSGMIDFPFEFDMLRLGIGMYGYGKKNLKPVMEIKSFVSKKFYCQKGENIGYSDKFKVSKSGFYAIVPVGYGDGLRRKLSNKFSVKINNKLFRSVGLICMDCFFVEIDESVSEGDAVSVMFDAEILAKPLKTISYEVLTGFSNFRGQTIVEE